MYNPNQFTGYQPNQFTGYQPNYYQQPAYQYNQQNQGYSQQSQGFSQQAGQGHTFAWVQGEAGAKAYPVNPGTTAWLMDSESMCFYIKTVDQNGVPQPLEIYDYAKREAKAEAPKTDMSQYVTKDEMKAYFAELLKGNTNEPTVQEIRGTIDAATI